MANRTDPLARGIHGTNPQNLVEKIVRQKIYNSTYWKQYCFGLTAELLVDRAYELRAVGGTFGGARMPTDFLCLILKMLQIQPDKDIIQEFVMQDDNKYARMLGAFYMRLVGRPVEVYQYLEPLYNDYRKVRLMTTEGAYTLTHVDELIEAMIYQDHLFDIALPRLPHRHALEEASVLEARISVLSEEFDEAALEAAAGTAAQQAAALEAQMAQEAEEQAAADGATNGARDSRDDSRYHSSRHDRDYRERDRDRDRDRDHDRDRDDDRERRRARDRDRERDRDRDRDRERRHARDDDDDRRRERRRRDRSASPDRHRDKKKKRGDEEDMDVAEANALRAKLGLRPLK